MQQLYHIKLDRHSKLIPLLDLSEVGRSTTKQTDMNRIPEYTRFKCNKDN